MEFSNPQSNILQMGLREGMRVVDVGSGVGHYALAAAPVVGADGRVYALDVQEDVLKALKREAVEHGFSNITTVWGDIEVQFGTKLKAETADAVILGNVLFQIEDTNAALTEIRRILKPGGKVLVVDWAGSYGNIGPRQENVIEEYKAERLFLDMGFHKEKAFRAGPHHYALVFKKPA
ncbi:MAG: class I SAM-dependent methyltransferase [Patescibacteria group bacterium UBA2103]